MCSRKLATNSCQKSKMKIQMANLLWVFLQHVFWKVVPTGCQKGNTIISYAVKVTELRIRCLHGQCTFDVLIKVHQTEFNKPSKNSIRIYHLSFNSELNWPLISWYHIIPSTTLFRWLVTTWASSNYSGFLPLNSL